MQEDLTRKTPLTSLSEEISRRRAELDGLQAAFQARALDHERALAVVEHAAVQVRRNLGAGSRNQTLASVQTSIMRWVRENPNGRRLREILPLSVVSDGDLVQILESWPESRDQVVQLLEAKP